MQGLLPVVRWLKLQYCVIRHSCDPQLEAQTGPSSLLARSKCVGYVGHSAADLRKVVADCRFQLGLLACT